MLFKPLNEVLDVGYPGDEWNEDYDKVINLPVHTTPDIENEVFSMHFLLKPYDYMSELKRCKLWPPNIVRHLTLVTALERVSHMENQNVLHPLGLEWWRKQTFSRACHGCCLPTHKETATAIVLQVKQAARVCMDCAQKSDKKSCRPPHPKEQDEWKALFLNRESTCESCRGVASYDRIRGGLDSLRT